MKWIIKRKDGKFWVKQIRRGDDYKDVWSEDVNEAAIFQHKINAKESCTDDMFIQKVKINVIEIDGVPTPAPAPAKEKSSKYKFIANQTECYEKGKKKK